MKGTRKMTLPSSTALTKLRCNGAFWVVIMNWGIIVPLLLTEILSGRFDVLMLVATCAIAMIATLDYVTAAGTLRNQLISAVALALGVALIVYQFQNHPWQPDIRMLFFAALAVLAVYCSWAPIVAFTLVVTLHHLVFFVLYPSVVFYGDVALSRVLLHVTILLIEAAALILIVKVIVASLERSEQDKAQAENALQEAGLMRAERVAQRQVSAQERAAHLAEQQRVVSEIEAGLIRLASGDLSRAIDSPASNPFPPDYEVLRNAFNNSMHQMHDLVEQVDAISGFVRKDAAEIAKAASDMHASTTFQADMALGSAQTLQAAIQKVANSLDAARTAEKESLENQTLAEAGGEIVQKAIAAMQAIETGSEQITRIIGVIEDIAFQTNLLALNAGVEAARAGSAGSGFAVVATEVRGLAERATTSAREIRQLISESEEQVKAGAELVNQSGAALAEIVSRAAHIRSYIDQLVAAADDQTAELHKAKASADRSNTLTGQTQSALEQTRMLVKGITDKVDELLATLAAFKTPVRPVDIDFSKPPSSSSSLDFSAYAVAGRP
jgi:methyl-accepting chemotaxis protein